MSIYLFNLIILCLVIGIPTFLFIENHAFKHDKSGIQGMIWGTVITVLVLSIVAVAYLILIVRQQG